MVLLCAIGIFATVPVARRLQHFIYDTVGQEFFTYIVLFVIGVGFISLLYFFVLKLRVKSVSQYIWLSVCTGLYVFSTFQLRTYPEEAIHLLEYGLLSFLLFKALSHRIRDWTVYVSALLFVLFFGIANEFLQWTVPGRYWGFKDVGLDVIGGGILILAIWQGIKPKIICEPVKRISVQVLVGMITLDLIVLGLCLSNTPGSVNRYTATFTKLSWLRTEEPMTEFGYKHQDSNTGTFISRMTVKELRNIDSTMGVFYGKDLLKKISSELIDTELTKTYTRNTNPFLYEFLIHLNRRKDNSDTLEKKGDPDEHIRKSNVAFRENVLLEAYFGNTLKHSGSVWSEKKAHGFEQTASLWKGDYISNAGQIITSFNLKTAWSCIVIMLVVVWASGEFYKRRIDK